MPIYPRKNFGGDFIIFHPSDFSPASELAFAHALKIALQSKAKLDIMHVEPHLNLAEEYWLNFPGIRSTLARWGILPTGARREAVAKAGLRIRKILTGGLDPVDSMLRHFRKFRPHLIVLATHQRDGLARWMHKPVAEPLARKSGAMTLFIAPQGRGFVSLDDGRVNLKRILVPVDQDPHPQLAIEKASMLAQGMGCVGAEFRLLHVGRSTTMPMSELPPIPGSSYDTVIRQGNILNEILRAEQEWQADLLVLATRGHLDFLDALRGSTTERVVRGARCPVLAVPARS